MASLTSTISSFEMQISPRSFKHFSSLIPPPLSEETENLERVCREVILPSPGGITISLHLCLQFSQSRRRPRYRRLIKLLRPLGSSTSFLQSPSSSSCRL
ncbi:hypothetical protein C4D60_Mb09t16230 [Musa balbisiana]|uniref:Uncharacterized protein n=1 Tax=Musa balbisiana TaxID=52838 RepID=A0A4S8IGW0_MUSBA|nr:hypothetical protein C4D60_Mb09t16230 [Musa balbisiana]